MNTVRRRGANAWWTAAAAIAVLWPSHVLSAFDGVPLNRAGEALVVGIVLPALWWVDRHFLERSLAHAIVLALLVVKAGSTVLVPQHGLCARFSIAAPLSGVVSTIHIDEPAGLLRSWDVRADWRDVNPRCTAILDRDYATRNSFPAAFRNLLLGVGRPESDVALDVDGYLTVDRSGTFTLPAAAGLRTIGNVGGSAIVIDAGRAGQVTLQAGSHHVQLHSTWAGADWRFEPLWNGRDAWSATRLTVSPSGRADAVLSPAIAVATPALVLLLVALWTYSALRPVRLSWQPAVFAAAAAAVFAIAALAPPAGRYAPALLLATVLLPLARRQQNARTAFVLLGCPWLALFAASAWTQAGRVTIYTPGDDWQMYQIAAYRIFLNGRWIEGGSPTFYFQAFYRWIAGALHLVFGDSSIGETYWDAACLLAAALFCFALVKRIAGFRWALAAAALVLLTFTVGPTWYLIGRGLSEISGLGWLIAAAAFVVSMRRVRVAPAAAAGVFAVLMFYTRLNHLLLTAFLLALLLPARTPARWRELASAVQRVRLQPIAIYASVVAAGVMLFALRTWWYTGHFSIVYGTAFGPQQTGLTLGTIGSPAVWSRIGEAFAAQLTMREPPAIDVRSTLVVVGAVVSALALLQVPHFERLPAPLALITVGTLAGSLFAHTHDYPGRMSVHVVPFAVAVSTCAAARLFVASRRRRPDLAPAAFVRAS